MEVEINPKDYNFLAAETSENITTIGNNCIKFVIIYNICFKIFSEFS